MNSNLDNWADIYDVVYSHIRDDISFYVEAARESGGPVLELGCGTGRVSIPICQEGIDVFGLDSSSAMLNIARRKVKTVPSDRGVLTLVEGDMRDFSMEKKFPLIIIPFRGYLSLLTVEDQTRALSNISRHLMPEGKLIFDVFVPDLNMLVQEGDVSYHLRDVTDPNTGTRYVLWHQSNYDNHNQIVNVRITIEELNGIGLVVRRLYRDFQLRYIHRWEMHYLLKLAGYHIWDMFGDFEGSSFNEESREMVWVTAVGS